jgi:RND family efflux transporter MFP subunit
LANGEAYPAEGKIELMSMEANRNTDTVQIYALFDNPDFKLLPNSTVKVTLAKKTSKKLPAIPSAAVMYDSQGAYVWLVENGDVVKKQHVLLGNTDGASQMILSGLTAGAEIVTDGTHKVMDGIKIVPDRQGR